MLAFFLVTVIGFWAHTAKLYLFRCLPILRICHNLILAKVENKVRQLLEKILKKTLLFSTNITIILMRSFFLLPDYPFDRVT